MSLVEGTGMAAPSAAQAQGAFYCSTSGTYFNDKESLAEHYKSDFHRYNLKRKVAGLPPVTKEWFEARKAQLTTAAASTTSVPTITTWIDPLTKKKFASENTYLVFVRSKKYLELVKKSGQPAPPPSIVTRLEQAADAAAAPSPAPKEAGYKVVLPSGGLPLRQVDGDGDAAMAGATDEHNDDDEDGSGWETASDDDDEEALQAAVAAAGQQGDSDAVMKEAEKWADWDLCRSLFDNHISASMQANLEYMLKRFGFYLPDAEYLKDPEGLLKYLGAKLQAGGVPLYLRGDDVNAKQFRSLHAVQRHMVDTNQCKIAYDGNEDEYAEFYDYEMGVQGEGAEGGEDEGRDASTLAVVASGYDDESLAVGAVAGELVLKGGAAGGGTRVLGTRDLARYYKQRHRPEDSRRSVTVATMLNQYRLLGAPTNTNDQRDLQTKKEVTRQHRAGLASQLKMSMIKNKLKKLPQFCPY